MFYSHLSSLRASATGSNSNPRTEQGGREGDGLVEALAERRGARHLVGSPLGRADSSHSFIFYFLFFVFVF